MTTADFAAVFAALYAAHQVADHWIQTDHQAAHKGQPGWAGRRACAVHVATYGATQLAAIGALVLTLNLTVPAVHLVAGMAVNLGTHYLADRRTPLRWIAGRLGLTGFLALGTPRPDRNDNPSLGTGAYALDQSWHIGWLFITALIIAA
ncbi:DUF3307 domain-containing protein [Micromonospora sp. NPDC023633]|uniref:DUF3307 domain-containing protein n=1 Tax=Micromonospora sp. NPDC023633 TaxID=3154320 RepID=UPI00340E1326